MESASNNISPEDARAASKEQIPALLHDVREAVLRGLLDNPEFNERHVCLLLLQKEVPSAILEEVGHRERWLRSYEVRRALAFHPHVPNTIGLHLVRELYVTDLVQLTMAASAAPPLRQLAEELVFARLPQLPPAQKMILGRRGSARIAGALLADGQPEVVPTVLESPFLNEGQVLRVLSRINMNARVVTAIAESGRWNQHYSVRLALVRNPQAPLATVLSFLPSISTTDLRILAESSSVPANVRPHVRRELANRMQHGKVPVKRSPLPRK
jgi:hypothetical protein